MSTVLYRVEDRVARITLDRPEKLNAINAAMRTELYQALGDVRANPDVWIAVLDARGRAFCVGHDLSEPIGEGEAGPSVDDLYLFMLGIYKPIVAAINGYCLAQGAGLALCSDIRVASEQAQLGWPQVKRGIGSISGPALLTPRVPFNLAMEAIFTGDPIDAARALQLGLVNRVVPHDQLAAATDELVAKIRANAPLPMRAIKEAALRGAGMATVDRVRFASLMLQRIGQTEDAKEGLAAFAEKRAPTWKGR